MKDFLERASKAYYTGNPIISDAEYDVLAANFGYNSVGHRVTDGIAHFHRMYSLKTLFDLSEAPVELRLCVSSPKLDGAAISILYVAGELSLALTRGDGEQGYDITDKISKLVPDVIPLGGIIQINGEVVAPKCIPNSRNYVSGALNLNSLETFMTRDLTFVAYDIVENNFKLWSNSMGWLQHQGFTTVLNSGLDKFPTDGIVFRVDDNATFRELGYTSKHPRGAFALKEQKKGAITTLTDVVWQVGRSGVVSPVAILEPVLIDDAVVSRATLHNIEYIEGLNLEIGCTVEVIRSGEIIPRIVRRLDDENI